MPVTVLEKMIMLIDNRALLYHPTQKYNGKTDAITNRLFWIYQKENLCKQLLKKFD